MATVALGVSRPNLSILRRSFEKGGESTRLRWL